MQVAEGNGAEPTTCEPPQVINDAGAAGSDLSSQCSSHVPARAPSTVQGARGEKKQELLLRLEEVGKEVQEIGQRLKDLDDEE